MTPKESSCLNWHGDSFHMKRGRKWSGYCR